MRSPTFFVQERKIRELEKERDDLLNQLNALRNEINSPELGDFIVGVRKEVAHQKGRWGNSDSSKNVTDWYWLIGYLGGKALNAYFCKDMDKVRHHIITTAAACYHWHRQMKPESSKIEV